MATSSAQKRVLSIQSHVVSGYVGNKAAVFPLQLLGFDVDVVNSVHFSNAGGYPKGLEGDVLEGDQLRAILRGLERNDLLHNVGHLLTGYIRSASFLEAIVDVLITLRKDQSTTIRYVCDPVLGDHGEFYVPPELVPLYREKIIPQANIVTPNQFEVEQLTGIKVTDLESAQKACQIFHDMGPSLVLITSMDLQTDDNMIYVLASRRIKSKATQVWQIGCPKLPCRYRGTGDLFASLLLAHTALVEQNETETSPEDFALVLERVTNTMYSVIERSWKESPLPPESPLERDLRLIQSKKDIENPVVRFRAKRLV